MITFIEENGMLYRINELPSGATIKEFAYHYTIKISPDKGIFQADGVDKVIVKVYIVDYSDTPYPYSGPLTVTVEGEQSVQQAVDGSLVIEITSAAAGIVDVSAEHEAWGMGVLELYAQ